MSQHDFSLSIAAPVSGALDNVQRAALALAAIGVLLFLVSIPMDTIQMPWAWMAAAFGITSVGAWLYIRRSYAGKPAGIKNDGVWHSGTTARGAVGWVLAIVLTGFYVLLYFYPERLGLAIDGTANRGIVGLFDPLSRALSGKAASQWFVYGALYTFAILVMGAKFIVKHRHNRYQIIRTCSVMFFQLGFAFLIPELLQRLNYPYHNFANQWPLNYYFFDEWNVRGLLDSGGFGMFMLFSGVAMVFLVSPVLTYFFGKRWFCSWVCGCGGLAETAGDPFRQLSDKGVKAWKVERWLVHSVLVFVVVMTAALVYSYTGDGSGFHFTRGMLTGVLVLVAGGSATVAIVRPGMLKELRGTGRWAVIAVQGVLVVIAVSAWASGRQQLFFVESYPLREWYGFLIGATFSGVIGVGFYPLMGSRVWCRYGCPMAAILGLQQRFFSRFRITTNGGQCISCGNCSTYCEMGIDVRAYAQRGENIVRASCVGCGLCASVCPRGVLKLENGKPLARLNDAPLSITATGVRMEL
jgi:polyferredoxin